MGLKTNTGNIPKRFGSLVQYMYTRAFMTVTKRIPTKYSLSWPPRCWDTYFYWSDWVRAGCVAIMGRPSAWLGVCWRADTHAPTMDRPGVTCIVQVLMENDDKRYGQTDHIDSRRGGGWRKKERNEGEEKGENIRKGISVKELNWRKGEMREEEERNKREGWEK